MMGKPGARRGQGQTDRPLKNEAAFAEFFAPRFGIVRTSVTREAEAAEEKKEDFYRCERAHGNFYRAVPLPDGVMFEDIKATFADGVLEVSFPVAAKAEAKVRRVEIEEGKAPKAA